MALSTHQDVSRLPKWAQRQLEAAKDRAERAEARLAAHLETVEKTRISYGEFNNPHYIPEHNGHQTVSFRLGDSDRYHDKIDVSIQGDRLQIIGGHSVSIDPYSSNLFYVRFND